MTRAKSDRLEVRPLTAERFGDLAALFEEGGDPRTCWCMWFRWRGREWSAATTAQKRAGLAALAESGPAPGLVAYRDGRAIGWVSLAPREAYDRLEHSTLLRRIDARPVWSIVCFVVARSVRGQGVAAALLDAAVAHARSSGATTLEAYPVATSRGQVAAADAFHGTQRMFERAGFRVIDVRRFNATSPPRPIMRLDLA